MNAVSEDVKRLVEKKLRECRMKLKPCPFCGSENVEACDCDEGFPAVKCHDCGVTVCSCDICKYGYGEWDIKTVWNRRSKE